MGHPVGKNKGSRQSKVETPKGEKVSAARVIYQSRVGSRSIDNMSIYPKIAKIVS